MRATPILPLVFLCLFIWNPLASQNSIQGSIQDAEGEALSFANVLLLNAVDSSFAFGNISDDAGSFEFGDLNNGNYLVQISMIGYTDYYSGSISLEGSTQHQMESIILLEDAIQLEGVEIVEKRPLYEQQIDRMVVNVENSITSSGTNALEILARSPGVLVNPQSNSIMMSGKDGVVVMINGRISRMPMDALVQTLQGMSSDNIEKIELIHTPPSNFDAEGNAGFINIVLKKNLDDGFNGNLNANAGYGRGLKAGGGINFNYRKGKSNLYGDYSINRDESTQVIQNFRSFVNDQGNTISSFSDSDRDPTQVQVQNARLGYDLNIGDKTIVGVLTSVLYRDWYMEAFNDVSFRENGNLTSRIEIPNDEDNERYEYLVNVNVNHRFNPGESINLDLDYTYFENENPSNYTNNFFDAANVMTDQTGLRVQKTTPMDIYVGALDYSKRINDKLTIDLGVKGTSISFDNDVSVEELNDGVWTIAPLFSSLATLDERIYGSYVNLSFNLGPKTDIKTGVRFESTDTNLSTAQEPNIVDREYSNLFPTFFLTHKAAENSTIQFSYSRRINRPSFMQLAPFFIFYDPNTVLTGNPQLQPSFSDNFRVAYSVNTIQIEASYAYTDETIGRWQPEVDQETNTQVTGARNFDNSHLVSGTLTFPITFTDWLEYRNSWSAQWSRFTDKAENLGASFDQFSWYMNGTLNFDFPNDWGMEISGRYFAPSLAGTVLWQDAHRFDFGIQKKINNSTIRFTVANITEGTNWTGRLDDPAVDFIYEGSYAFAERTYSLNFSTSFGSSDVKQARQRQTSSAEERARTN